MTKHSRDLRDPVSRRDAVDIQNSAYSRGQFLRIDLQAGGGFIGRFSR